MSSTTHDVVVLGASIAGSTLATLLARLGKRVALVDAGLHPRFAIGEATTPYTTHSLNLIAEQFDVPALAPRRLFRGALRQRCGVKRNFGFVYQRPGEEPDAREAQLSPVPTESHLFRQDTDAHIFALAVQHGVDGWQQTRVEKIAIDDDVVRVSTSQGKEIVARYLVDGSGFGSPIADLLGVPKNEPDLASHSGSMFTHMVEVRPFDELFPHAFPGRFHQGTLHHVFDGGWLWVIPFNNHRDSTNPLISVGLQLDPRRFTLPSSAEAETFFREFIAQFPSVERQFRHARSVRPWFVSKRLQYRSHMAGGPRWCRLPSAYGFIDPLYSKGLSQTFDAIRLIAAGIARTPPSKLRDLWTDLDLDGKYERWIRAHDHVTAGSYTSFRDATMWRQFWFTWFSTTVASEFALMSARVERRRGDHALPEAVNTTDHIPEASSYLRRCFAITTEVEEATMSSGMATSKLEALNRDASWMPPFARRYVECGYTRPPRAGELAETYRWLRTAEPHVGRIYRNLMSRHLPGVLA